jgi:hypothetical protein
MPGARRPNLEPTSFELDILQFHKAYTERYSAPPGLKTMARHFQVFPNTIRWHVQKLVEKGHLREKEPRPVTGKFVLSAKGRSRAG